MKIIKTLIFLFLTIYLSGCGYHKSEGEKIGSIVKLAKEGLICKTNESELIKGGMNNGSGGFGTKPFYFTIQDDSVLKIIEFALNNNKEVKIKYYERLIAPCDSGNAENAFAYSAEIVK